MVDENNHGNTIFIDLGWEKGVIYIFQAMDSNIFLSTIGPVQYIANYGMAQYIFRTMNSNMYHEFKYHRLQGKCQYHRLQTECPWTKQNEYGINIGFKLRYLFISQTE